MYETGHQRLAQACRNRSHHKRNGLISTTYAVYLNLDRVALSLLFGRA